MANGITSINFSDDLGVSPASTHRPSGQVWVNSSMLGKQFRKRDWDLVLDHEEGHIVLDTKSEFEADAYASTKFFNRYPNEPWDSVAALEKMLPGNKTPEMLERIERQKQRVQEFLKNHFTGKTETMPRISTNKFDNPDQDQPIALRFTDISIIDKIARGKNPAGIFGGKGIFLLRERPSASPPLQYKIDGWGGLSPIRPGSSPLWRGRGPSLNPGPSVDLRAPSIGFYPELSYFTNCSKYILKNRRQNCEAENQRERDSQLALARIGIEAKKDVSDTQSQSALSLAEILAKESRTSGVDQVPATGSNQTAILLIVVVAAAIAIGAVLYFTKKPA